MRTARVIGALDEWREELERAGVELRSGHDPVDLVVAEAGAVDGTADLPAGTRVIEGKLSRRQARQLGSSLQRFLPLPSLSDPELFLPLDQPGPARYVLTDRAAPGVRWKRGRNAILVQLLQRGLFPPVRPFVYLSSEPDQPFLVAATTGMGLPEDLAFVLEPGSGDDLARGVFHLFRPGAARPEWILKYGRVRDYPDPFDRDERGLTVAATAGGVAAAHAPILVGRFEVDGYQASVETAAAGRRLLAALNAQAPRAALLETVERIAAWIVAVGVETAGTVSELDAERRRVTEEVLPHWQRLGATPELMERLDQVRPVVTHNDLGSWNIVVDGRDFTAIDWESAHSRSFPLWDLWYFLADALAQVDRAGTLAEKEVHFAKLFAGELESSTLLFDWTRRAVAASSVPPDAVGPLATLCWLHHGRSHVARATALRQNIGSESASPFLVERAPEHWLSHPGLGPSWSAWPA